MQKRKNIFFILSVIFISCFFSRCTSEKGIPDYNEFPDEVGKIIFTKCATPGCHTDKSKAGAAGLSMESWDKLFEGGTGSACVIPYSSDYSTFFDYVNTYSDLGMTLTPTMPYNRTALSREDVTLLKNWIDAGAPSREGAIKFADDPNRKKFYVTNQGCDVVTVFDQKTLLPMRYINIGSSASTESPHMIRVSPDGQFWYVTFLAGQYLEKYRTSDDSFVGRAFIGSGSWNTFVITNNSQTAYCIDFNGGKIATVDLSPMTAIIDIGLSFPHGSTLNNTNDTLYISQQQNNKIYKFPVADFSAYSEVNLYTGAVPSPTLNSHEIRFTPTGDKYFVTCQGTSEVRVMQTGNDALLAIIPVGAFPSEMSFSSSLSTPFLFVTCMEDTLFTAGKRGSVYVINYNDYTFNRIYTGHQPHGIAVDDSKKLVYVINRNATNDGPAPHHSSVCGGRNGNVSFINLSPTTLLSPTMVLTPSGNIKKIEISVDPYSVSIRP